MVMTIVVILIIIIIMFLIVKYKSISDSQKMNYWMEKEIIKKEQKTIVIKFMNENL